MRHDLNFKPPSLDDGVISSLSKHKREIIGWESYDQSWPKSHKRTLGKKDITNFDVRDSIADPIPMVIEVLSFLFCEHS